MTFSVRMQQLLRRYGHGSLRSGRLVAALAGLSDDERHFIGEMEDLVRAGGRLNDLQALRAAELLARVVPQYRVRMLISTADNAFTVPQLQEIFLQETSHLAERPSVTAWLRSLSETSQAYGILRWLCGDNFQRQATLTQGLGTRLLSFFSVPSPRHMSSTPETALSELLDVPGARGLLFERLERALFEADHASGGAALLASGRISQGHFSVLKGNVAELLARGPVLDEFRQGNSFGSLPDGAVMLNGVRLRRPGARQATLFSDGLIGVIDGDQFQWIASVEVKAYDAGFSDGVAQVVRWSDVSHLSSAFTLELPAGATRINISTGALETVSTRLRFPFNPAQASTVNRVSIPSAGVGHLVVAPLGASHFDLSELGASAPTGRVIQITHPVASDAIDHFTALVLQEAAGQSSVPAALAAIERVTL